ncbi:hypothetical protein B7494_g5413 [Chlorociboria aeruginascens]|nr:hypothetical protein B7494_g5413 [Chlorociboria aeruginascens]
MGSEILLKANDQDDLEKGPPAHGKHDYHEDDILNLSPSTYYDHVVQLKLQRQPWLESLHQFMDPCATGFAMKLTSRMKHFDIKVINFLKSGLPDPIIHCTTPEEFSVAMGADKELTGTLIIAQGLSRTLIETLGTKFSLEPAFFANYLAGTELYREGGRLSSLLLHPPARAPNFLPDYIREAPFYTVEYRRPYHIEGGQESAFKLRSTKTTTTRGIQIIKHNLPDVFWAEKISVYKKNSNIGIILTDELLSDVPPASHITSPVTLVHRNAEYHGTDIQISARRQLILWLQSLTPEEGKALFRNEQLALRPVLKIVESNTKMFVTHARYMMSRILTHHCDSQFPDSIPFFLAVSRALHRYIHDQQRHLRYVLRVASLRGGDDIAEQKQDFGFLADDMDSVLKALEEDVMFLVGEASIQEGRIVGWVSKFAALFLPVSLLATILSISDSGYANNECHFDLHNFYSPAKHPGLLNERRNFVIAPSNNFCGPKLCVLCIKYWRSDPAASDGEFSVAAFGNKATKNPSNVIIFRLQTSYCFVNRVGNEIMGKRPGRAAAKNAAAALKNTPQAYDEGEDEQMIDAPVSDAGTPQDIEDENGDEDEETPAQESEVDGPTTPAPEPIPRKRRLGRPPKIKPPGWDTPDDNERDGSETGTPAKRGRGRGGFGRGGGRWARRGGPSHVTQQPVDKEGNMMDVINDEVELPEDPEGEAKVDKMGHLQGGREYRCRTFTVHGRGERLYMLSTEPARCVGFRDSYLFFTKHKRLFKIIIDEDEKRDMIERELIPHSYKGRAIGIVTARSVFREFGAQIVVGGKRIIDDYEVAKARAEGVVEGELADPNDAIKQGESYNKNQYVAWHGASSVYHSGAPTVPVQSGKAMDPKKRRIMVNDVNWMLEHAREASRFNALLGGARRQILNGIYDPHTNIMQYPKIMQPTHARWEQIDDNKIDEVNSHNEANDEEPSIFKPLKPVYSRNFMIVDTVYEGPPTSNLGVPGLDGDAHDLGFNGLSNIPSHIKAELPAECRKAFDDALASELQWKNKWGTEGKDTMRKAPVIDKGLIM